MNTGAETRLSEKMRDFEADRARENALSRLFRAYNPRSGSRVCRHVENRGVSERFSRIFAAFLVFFVVFSGFYDAIAKPRVDESNYFAATLYPKNSAKSFIIYHVDTDRVVASLNLDYIGPVASLTKMMTCLLADEMLDYNGKYKLTPDEAKALGLAKPASGKSSSRKGKKGGAVASKDAPPVYISLEQMLDLALVPSNNTVCKIIARLIDGNEKTFAARMTRRAKELGMEDTVYSNSSGLPSKTDQYSNVRDQVILALEVMKRPNLMGTVGKHYIFHLERWDSTMYYLKQRYPVAGIKTGWTIKSGRCIVILVEHPKFGRFVVVQLGSVSIPQGFVDAEIILSRFGIIKLADDSLLSEARRQEKERKREAEQETKDRAKKKNAA
ncbi:D-alanyl-D-alanine carboxypeptidase [bacterium]|nr:D-alanyl-D-alanine carboxypeptidase [bacterium]